MNYAESDDYLDNNDVFINKFGIKDKSELEKVEIAERLHPLEK